jgi:hypothetical protein
MAVLLAGLLLAAAALVLLAGAIGRWTDALMRRNIEDMRAWSEEKKALAEIYGQDDRFVCRKGTDVSIGK